MRRLLDDLRALVVVIVLVGLFLGPIGLFILGLLLPVVALAGFLAAPVILLVRILDRFRL